MKQMQGSLVTSLKMLGIMTVICGGVYTLAVTGIGQVVFPSQANGSVLRATDQDGKSRIVGSHLIGQAFTTADFLQGRPELSASNLSPVSQEQRDLVAQRMERIQEMNPQQKSIPKELVLASGSGLDPEISVAGAQFQIKRIADARGLAASEIEKIIQKHTSEPVFGKIGTARVNVLRVNLDLAGYQVN